MKKPNPLSLVVRIIDGDDELKINSRTSPDVQFKEFLMTKQKIDLEWTVSEMGKPKESEKKQEIKVKLTHVNKNY